MGRDWAVVLARGASRRMGSPKGALVLGPGGRTVLAAVLDLYRGAGIPAAVVTTADLEAVYRRAALDRPVARWIAGEAGAGTAETVRLALSALGAAADRLWLHPVDLPDVRPSSLDALRRAALAAPDAVLVPRYRGRRGHPVVLPTSPWRDRAGGTWTGEMRDVLTRAAAADGPPMRHVDLDDPGLVADLDAPEDLARPHGGGTGARGGSGGEQEEMR